MLHISIRNAALVPGRFIGHYGHAHWVTQESLPNYVAIGWQHNL
jgi:hypothetical protein